MKPEVSIIIPCFNCEDTLEDAVTSCFSQGLTHFEIVLVDDGSTDNTKVVMNDLAKKHKEIKCFYHEVNKGGGATRNTAVHNSQADVIFCLDSDDLLPENTLSKMLKFLEEKKAAGVGVSRSVKFIGKDVDNVDVVHEFGYVGEKIPLEALLQRDSVYCCLYSTFMFTKSAFEIAGGYPVEHGFDTQGFAWRFLSHGLTAYTCPDTTYLHRVQYKDSYYIRESQAGKINYNWRDIFYEHLNLFNKDAQTFITTFNCKDFSKDFFNELKKREKIFSVNVNEIIGKDFKRGDPPQGEKIYIQRNSFLGLLIRLRGRLRLFIKKNELIFSFIVFMYALLNRFRSLITETKAKEMYYKQIEDIKRERRIVIDLSFGGIGDCLAYSTLPRLLKETYNVDFYISKQSLEIIRHKDIYKFCFEMNPYFKGVHDDNVTFKFKSFESEKSLYTFFTDRNGKNIIGMLESQFRLNGKARPETYYKPVVLEEYKHKILIDENAISGKKFGWKFKHNAFYNEAIKYYQDGDEIEYIDPKKQDLFKYIDMIFSCKHFIGTSSGGAAISACFDKPFSVILPINASGGSLYQFIFRNTKGIYTT